MPFGSESTWDRLTPRSGPLPLALASPMPFGSESTWDSFAPADPMRSIAKSPMPFGSESTWDERYYLR